MTFQIFGSPVSLPGSLYRISTDFVHDQRTVKSEHGVEAEGWDIRKGVY